MLLNAVATPRHVPAGDARRASQQDVALVTLPLFHSTAQTCLMNAGLLGGIPPRAAAALRSRRRARDDASASRSGSGSACRRCTGRCCSTRSRGRSIPRPIAEHLRLCVVGRRADAGRGDARSSSRRSASRILEGYGLSETVAGRLLQPAASADQARNGGTADLRRRGPLRRRPGDGPSPPGSAARS